MGITNEKIYLKLKKESVLNLVGHYKKEHDANIDTLVAKASQEVNKYWHDKYDKLPE